MLNFKIVNTNGSVKKLEKILTASLDSETDIPADSLVITCPFDSGISKNADRIIVLDNGKIVEQGSHAELLKKGGEYNKLWSRQSGAFLDGD